MTMLSFASVDELMAHLRAESSKGERFATRFILVRGRKAWGELIHELGVEVERVISLSEFCSGPDVFPDVTRLEAYLREEATGCRSILLIPLAEYIRLDPESTEVIRWLSQWPADRVRRIYVPLFAVDEFFFPEIESVLRYKAGELPEPWIVRGEGSSDIIVAPFSADLPGRQRVEGIREYLKLWERGSVDKVWLVTAMAPWLAVRQTRSECRVRVYPSGFDYAQENLGWEEVHAEWGSSKQWEWLVAQAREGDSLDGLARRLLNVAKYDADQLFALWGNFDEDRRWLIWLWSKVRSEPGTYVHDVLRQSNHVNSLSHHAIMTIFDLQRSVSRSRQRKDLLQRLGVNLMPAEFWERYTEITEPLDRIAVLTDLSAEERKQVVLCVGELLTHYPHDVWWEYLEVSFPALAWYLVPAVSGDEFTNAYFSAYNRCRIKDQANKELSALIGRWADEQLLWNYPARSDLLAKLRDYGAKIIWVDAMGVEWTGLLTQLLAQHGGVKCEVAIARGHLPTTTEANKEWEDGESVERGLDDIAHHYAYEFPDSYLKALEIIRDVAYKALALLSQHPTVVITSDHGLSRFAAISEVKAEVPEGAEVKAPGRYSLLREGTDYENKNNLWVVYQGNAIWVTHGQFSGGGPRQGEVHGGGTPEEYLVPVIVVRKTDIDVLPRFELCGTVIRLDARGDGFLSVRCDRKVTSVELRVAGQALPGKGEAGLRWSFELRGWNAGKYTGRLYADGQLADTISFEVVKGLMQEDLGL